MSRLKFKPLSIDTWPDLEKLFGERGACGGCWCMYWRLPGKEYEKNKGENNKNALYKLAKSQSPLGVIAFDDADPAGWCQVSPRAELKRMENSRLFKPVDDKPVWSIGCLFVDRNYRKQNLSVKLIEAAVRFAKTNGATIVESYPVVPGNKKIPDVFAYHGLVSSFEKAGFKMIGKPSETRAMMRRFL